jgi:hypothetical protein
MLGPPCVAISGVQGQSDRTVAWQKCPYCIVGVLAQKFQLRNLEFAGECPISTIYTLAVGCRIWIRNVVVLAGKGHSGQKYSHQRKDSD